MKMPYLHWECLKEVGRLKKVLEEKKTHKQDQETSRKLGSKKVTDTELSNAEKLLWMYLGEDHPLHIRRQACKQINPNQIYSNQIKFIQIKLNQIKFIQIKSNQIGYYFIQIKSNLKLRFIWISRFI